MDYNEIKDAAYNYADRQDTETLNMYDVFLKLVESRINRVLKTLDMGTRSIITTSLTSEYYGLPDDFRGMRDLRVNGTTVNGEEATITCQYRTPAQINDKKNINETSGQIYYSIIARQLHIQPPLDNKELEMFYYQKIPPLTALNLNNWVSDEHEDCYIFGVLTEISAFNKDADTAKNWGARYDNALSEITNNDVDIRWSSGDALQQRLT